MVRCFIARIWFLSREDLLEHFSSDRFSRISMSCSIQRAVFRCFTTTLSMDTNRRRRPASTFSSNQFSFRIYTSLAGTEAGVCERLIDDELSQ